jgi:RNA polymerase primary sigma factor
MKLMRGSMSTRCISESVDVGERQANKAMAKTSGGNEATQHGSDEPKRAVAHSRSAFLPGASRARAAPCIRKSAQAESAARTAPATAVKAARSPEKLLEQADRHADEQTGAREAAAIEGGHRRIGRDPQYDPRGHAGRSSARKFSIHGSIGCRPAAASRD